MKTWKYLLFAIVLVSNFSFSEELEEDYLANAYMAPQEYKLFKERVGVAIANHPEFKSAQQLLIAAYADTKISKSSLLPQIQFLIDSSNALDRRYLDANNNLVERSQSDHKTNLRLTVNQLLYDFGATRYDISRSESLAKASRADLSTTILDLSLRAIQTYIDVAAYYRFKKIVESSYQRHVSIKERIQQRVDSGLAAARELSRAEAREAEAFAKLTSVQQSLSAATSRFRVYFPNGPLPKKLPFYPYDLSERSLDEARKIMLLKNTQLLMSNEKLNASKFKTKQTNASSRPRINFEIRGQQYDITEQDRKLHSDNYDIYSGVNFSYNLYSGGREAAMKEQAVAQMEATKSERDSLLQELVASLNESIKNLKLIPTKLVAYTSSYQANKRSQYFANEQFKTSNVLLLDLLQTERDYLDASEAMLETMRSSELQKYLHLEITGELGEAFEIILN